MNRARALATLRLLCTSGVELIAQMPLLSEQLRRLVPSFSLSMIRVDRRCVPTAHYSEYFDEASHRLFAASGDYFATKSPDPSAFANLLGNADPVGTLVSAPPGYVDGMVYQHLFAPNGIHHTLDVALRAQRTPLAILGIFRERRTRPFSTRDVETIRGVYAHLVHACLARPVPATFDELADAMLIVDRQGVVRWASAQARAWLEDATLGVDRARLIDAGLLPTACRELCARLDRHRRPTAAPTAPPHLALPVPGGRLRLRAYTLANEAGGVELFGIQLALEADRRLRLVAVLDRARLSAQLARLAIALVEGADTAQLCARLDIRRSTLKAYQRDLYRRFDVASAPELVERLEHLVDGTAIELGRHRPRPAHVARA